MAMCPSCKAKVGDQEKTCPMCGRDIPASTLENIQTQTSGWQKFVIAVVVLLLIVIGFTFYQAEDREDRAAQGIFKPQVERIIQTVATQSGISQRFGMPAYQLVAQPKVAEVMLIFPSGPLSQAQAAQVGRGVCSSLARTYVNKGYMPRYLRVVVAGSQPGGQAVYGQAVYNGNLDTLAWEPASR